MMHRYFCCLLLLAGCFQDLLGQQVVPGGYTNEGLELFNWSASKESSSSMIQIADQSLSGSGATLYSSNTWLDIPTGADGVFGAYDIVNSNCTLEGLFKPSKTSGDSWLMGSGSPLSIAISVSVTKESVRLLYKTDEWVHTFSGSGTEDAIHIAVVRSYKPYGSTSHYYLNLYVNGEAVTAPLSYSEVIGYVPSDMPIMSGGLATGTGSDSYTGSADNVRIWSMARTGTQILSHKDVDYPLDVTGLMMMALFNRNSLYDNRMDPGNPYYTAIGSPSMGSESYAKSTDGEQYESIRSSLGHTGLSIQGASNSLTAHTARTISLSIKTSEDVTSTQLLYKQRYYNNSYTLYIENGTLYLQHLSHMEADAVSSTLSIGSVSAQTFYLAQVLLSPHAVADTWEMSGWLNGAYGGKNVVSNIGYHADNELSIGISNGHLELDRGGVITMTGAQNYAFKGDLLEISIRKLISGYAKSQEHIDYNYLMSGSKASPSYEYGSATQRNYTWVVDGYGSPVYRRDFAGIGYISSTDKQEKSKSSYLGIQSTGYPNADEFIFWASERPYTGAAETMGAPGYLSNTENAALNTRLTEREWKILAGTGTSGYMYELKMKVRLSLDKTQMDALRIPGSTTEVPVIVLSRDKDYRNKGYVIALSYDPVSGDYVSGEVDLSPFLNGGSPVYGKAGFLHQYEYASPGGYTEVPVFMGKTNIGYDVKTWNSGELSIDNVKISKAQSYVIAYKNGGSYTSTSTASYSNNASEEVSVTRSAAIWRFNIYGAVGTMDIHVSEDIMGTPGTAPAGYEYRHVLLVSQDESFPDAQTRIYALSSVGAYKKGFFLPIKDKDYIRVGYALYKVIQPEVKSAESSGAPVSGTVLSLYTSDQSSFDLAGACPEEIQKSSLNVFFSTGELHKTGNLGFSSTVRFKITGYAGFTSGSPELFTLGGTPGQELTLTLSENGPESVYHTDLSSYYPALKRIDVTVVSYSAPDNELSALFASMKLKAQIDDEVKVQTPITVTSPLKNMTAAAVPVTSGSTAASTQYTFGWENNDCRAQYYQFQLLRLYNEDAYLYEGAHPSDPTTISTKVDWSKALLIETPSSSLSLTMAEGTGYYAWRVRPIGSHYAGGVADSRNWGNWTTDNVAIPATPQVLNLSSSSISAYGSSIFWYTQFEQDKNFIYSRSFTEEGKIHESMSYATPLLQSKQSLARINGNDQTEGENDQQILVSQTMYDFAGRGALSSLASPVNGDHSLYYRNEFLQYSGNTTANKLYTAFNFDTDGTYKNADPIDAGALASYYSNLNGDLYVPSADGYPFSRQIFDNDGTNQVIEQGGPGLVHHITPDASASHTVKVSYAGVSDDELVIVFGDEAPDASSVFKTVTTDQNNISSITYTDKEGHVIATCLAKRPTGELYTTDQLSTALRNDFDITITEEISNNKPSGDNGYVSSQVFVFSQPVSDLSIYYEMTPAFFTTSCRQDYCTVCDYNLTVQVIRVEDGKSIYSHTQAIPGHEPLKQECTQPETVKPLGTNGTIVSFEGSTILAAGKYVISKRIEVDKSKAVSYANSIADLDKNALESITLAFSTRMKVPDLSRSQTQKAYWDFISNSTTGLTPNTVHPYSVIVTDILGRQRYPSAVLPLTAISSKDDLQEGMKLAVQLTSGCCGISIPVVLPEYTPCKDPNIIDDAQEGEPDVALVEEAYIMADSMVQLYYRAMNLNVLPSNMSAHLSDVMSHTQFSDPDNRTTSWTIGEFRNLIYNYNDDLPMNRAQCQKLWDSWQANTTSVSSGQLVLEAGPGEANNPDVLAQQANSEKSKFPSNMGPISDMHMNTSSMNLNIIENMLTEVMGNARRYHGFTNNFVVYKEHAHYLYYKYFEGTGYTVSTDPHACERVFCSYYPAVPGTTAACAENNCLVSVISYSYQDKSIANAYQLSVEGHGRLNGDEIYNGDTLFTYRMLKGCQDAQGNSQVNEEAPEFDFAAQKEMALSMAKIQIDACKNQCELRDAAFLDATRRFYDPQGTGSYTYYNTGSELIPNGDFSDALSGEWSTLDNVPLTSPSFNSYISSYGLQVLRPSSSYGITPGYSTSSITIPGGSGTSYRFICDLVNNEEDYDVIITAGGYEKRVTEHGQSHQQFIFEPASSGQKISVRLYYKPSPTGTAPITAEQFHVYIDNISVKEILSGSTSLDAGDACCMAQSLTDYCKEQCKLTVQYSDCNNDEINDKVLGVGTEAEIKRMRDIMYGPFTLSETLTDGSCQADFEKVIPSVNTVPPKCGDPAADIIWDKTYSVEAHPNGVITDIQKDAAGNIYIMEFIHPGGSFAPSVIRKINPVTGEELWHTGNIYNFSYKFICAGENELIFWDQAFVGSDDVRITKRVYTPPLVIGGLAVENTDLGFDHTYGGSGNESIRNIYKTSGGFVCVGTSDSPACTEDCDSENHYGKKAPKLYGTDIWYFKIDHNGIMIWDKTAGRDGVNDGINRVSTDDLGNIYIESSVFLQPSYFFKLDPEGIKEPVIWELPTNDSYNESYFIGHREDEILHMSIKYTPRISLQVYNGATAVGNRKSLIGGSYGGTFFHWAMTPAYDGGYYLYANTNELTSDITNQDRFSYSRGSVDIIVAKFDADWNKEWDQTFGGTSDESIYTSSPNQLLLGLSDGSFVFTANSRSGPVTSPTQSYGNKTTSIVEPLSYQGNNWFVRAGEIGTLPCTPKEMCIRWDGFPVEPPPIIVVEPPLPVDPPLVQVVKAITFEIAQCKADRLQALEDEYLAHCLGAGIPDKLTASYEQGNHHYTLYYYDRAGNLVRTVPPAGVRPATIDAVTLRPQRLPLTHELVTEYRYNSLGQLLSQKTPDAGTTDFIYNSVGQLRFSRNAKQNGLNQISYTKYDELGRIIEVGQGASVNWSALTTAQADGIGIASYPASNTSEQTYTVYTDPAGQISYQNRSQRHLRNRVSYSYTRSLFNNETAATYYSYDAHGNVAWLVQELPGQSRNQIGYEYDLISNKVLQVSYNQGQPDVFYHKYRYDADNRITSVLTSRDRLIWDTDASYSYYKHGPLKRMALGEDKIQGVDYTYTIQGWLKALNHPALANDYTQDPGQDGTGSPGTGNADYASDEYGMTLNYYQGDFTRSGGLYNPKTGTAAAYTAVSAAGRQLYNGNISSWVSRIEGEYRKYQIDQAGIGGTVTAADKERMTTANFYSYDDLNRITASTFGEYSSALTAGPGTDQYTDLTSTGKYATAYSYDGNGNILTLQRYGSSGMIDQLNYGYMKADGSLLDGASYSAGISTPTNPLQYLKNNRLYVLKDPQGTSSATEDIDDYSNTSNTAQGTNQQAGITTTDRYGYDAIGNLVSDKAENVQIEWTVYGKVSAVKRLVWNAAGTAKPEVRYTYDASGNRIKKEVNTQPYTSAGVPQRLPQYLTTTFYVRDAAGNVMSIYSRTNTALSGDYYAAAYDQTEIPVYGSSRLGEYKPGAEEARVMTKKFKTSDLDKILYDYGHTDRSNTDQSMVVLSNEARTIGSTIGDIKVNSINSYLTDFSGSEQPSTFNVTTNKQRIYSGIAGNGLASAYDKAGTLKFTAFTAKNYYGTENKLIVTTPDGMIIPGAEYVTADPNAQIAITQVPGSSTKYYLVTRSAFDPYLQTYVITEDQTSHQLSFAFSGTISHYQNNTQVDFYGAGLAVNENHRTGNTMLYMTAYKSPESPEEAYGKVQIIGWQLPSDPSVIQQYYNSLPVAGSPIQVLAEMPGLMERREESGELVITSKGDKLLFYNQKQHLGWFSHQQSDVIVFPLDRENGLLVNNALASAQTIPMTDASNNPMAILPGGSAAAGYDGRFIYFSKDQLYKTNSSAAHIGAYDTRNNTPYPELTSSNYSGDLRNEYYGLAVLAGVDQSQTGVSYTENEEGSIQAGAHNVSFSASAGSIGNLPVHNYRLFALLDGTTVNTRSIGRKSYELNDHLGNVTVVVSDRKLATTANDNTTITTIAEVKSYTNYYAFGMAQKERSCNLSGYRYGFNGKEKEDAVDNGGYDFGARIYDSRIGRFLSVDPLSFIFSENSPYSFADNNAIEKIDVDGMFPDRPKNGYNKSGKGQGGKVINKGGKQSKHKQNGLKHDIMKIEYDQSGHNVEETNKVKTTHGRAFNIYEVLDPPNMPIQGEIKYTVDATITTDMIEHVHMNGLVRNTPMHAVENVTLNEKQYDLEDAELTPNIRNGFFKQVAGEMNAINSWGSEISITGTVALKVVNVNVVYIAHVQYFNRSQEYGAPRRAVIRTNGEPPNNILIIISGKNRKQIKERVREKLRKLYGQD